MALVVDGQRAEELAGLGYPRAAGLTRLPIARNLPYLLQLTLRYGSTVRKEVSE